MHAGAGFTMFEGFDATEVDVGETRIFCRRKGNGPPLLLLHGFPETHVMWHRVAPVLAEKSTVVCADLRGYGASGKPQSTSDHAPYAKAAMAGDMGRAAATLDREADAEDRAAGRQIEAPLLVLWSADGPLDDWYAAVGGPLALWRERARDVRGQAVPGGHFFPEQNPTTTSEELRSFFLEGQPT